MKISFLVAAHNEEKIIKNSLENLLHLPFSDYEVIVGLDGCTDGTEEIVKGFCEKSEKFRYYKLNLREGKPAVISYIIKKAVGEIIIINDADWIFKVKNKEKFEEFISVFNNKKIGAIAESFPVEWRDNNLEKFNLGFRMTAYSSYFWLEYQKKKLSYKKGKVRYLKEPTMFLTNIFRKELYVENSSLGDDFERTYDIMKKGYEIVLFEDINMPRMTSVYNKIDIKDLFKQKIRTAIARSQVKDEQEVSIEGYYLPVLYYINKESWRKGISIGLMVLSWTILTILAAIVSKFKKKNTKEGWKLRARK